VSNENLTDDLMTSASLSSNLAVNESGLPVPVRCGKSGAVRDVAFTNI